MAASQSSLGWRWGSKPQFSRVGLGPPEVAFRLRSQLARLCAAALALRLCAPPKTLRTRQPLPVRFSLQAALRQVLRTAYPQPPLPSFGLQTFPPLTPILTQGASSRLLERAARPAVGRQCGRGVPNDHFAESGQRQRGRLASRPPSPRRAHPEAPTPGLTGSTPSPTFQPPRTTLSAQPS